MGSRNTEGVARGQMKIRGFDEPEMDFQLLRGLGVANYGGSSVGEMLAASTQVKQLIDAQAADAHDPAAAWTRAFSELGQRVEALGQTALSAGHRVSAREHFMRASMYYRAAEYYCDPFKPAHRRWGMASREAFIFGASLLNVPVQVVQIPYEQAWIPAYYFSSETDDGSSEPRKTLLVNTGFDGSGEELYFEVGRAALERGYNVLLMDGPGQTGMTRLHPHLKFRPDWETPIRKVLDWLYEQPGVDTKRIAYYGISLGGYFATRATCHEPRIAALIANSPIVDLKRYQMGFFPPGTADAPPELMLEWMDSIPPSELPDSTRALLRIAFFRFGTESLQDWLRILTAFRTDQDLGRIRIPCLSLVGESEGGEPLKQAQYFCEHVAGAVHQHVFGFREGADTHCQVANLPLSAAVIFDWLDNLFK